MPTTWWPSTGGTASSEGAIDQSDGIFVSDSDISAEQGVSLTGVAGNSTPDGAELGTVLGVRVETSTLTASAGQVNVTGTGGSGSVLEASSGVFLDGSDLRAASLSITGDGGRPQISTMPTSVLVLQSTAAAHSTAIPAMTSWA